MSEVVEVNVRSLAFGGAGVGEVTAQSSEDRSLLGISAFVPFTIPGERVSASINQRKKRYIEAELAEILSTSADRISPKCRHFGQCGGCELQHMSYEAQLREKSEMVRTAMQAGRLPFAAIEALKPVRSGAPFHYRRRMMLHVDSTGRVGFYRTRSRSVVGLQECPIADPAIEREISKLSELGKAVSKNISSIILEADEHGVVVVLKSPYDLSRTEIERLLGSAKKFFNNVVLMSAEKEVGGIGRKVLELPLPGKAGLRLQVAAGTFSQVNWAVNQSLLETSLELTALSRGATVCDLYAGAGNFALAFAAAGARVFAVECEPRLVSMGRQVAEKHGFDLEYLENSVEKYLASRASKKEVDLIIADPPRSGLGPLVSQLDFGKSLLLVSCHLASFVRDLKALLEQGWQLETVQPFDMFAQTTYLEVVALLRRSGQ